MSNTPYVNMEELPYDSELPEKSLPAVVDLILPPMPSPKPFNWLMYFVTVLVFFIAASPIADHYFGKRMHWLPILVIKLFFFMVLYGIIDSYR